MTKKWLPVLALALLLIAPMVSAQNTFVLVFLEDAPLRHIKVAIDGKIVGVTDGKGWNYEPGGRTFESCRARHITQGLSKKLLGPFSNHYLSRFRQG